MQYVKVILLYFVLPIFGFVAFLVSQVGFVNLDRVLGLTAILVAAILFLINTGWGDGRDDDEERSDADWDGYYTMQQSERLHHQHDD